MTRLLALLLARRSIYGFSLAWGAAVILVAGLAMSDFVHGTGVLGLEETRPDRLYHYHVSGLLAAGLAFVLLLAAGLAYSRDARAAGLPDAARTVLLVELVAVAAGAGLALGAGWLKEIRDALQGYYADQDDIAADLGGVLPPALAALAVLLPTQGALALFGEALRHRLLHALTPADLAPQVDRAQAAAGRIRRSLRLARQEHDAARGLERSVRRAGPASLPGRREELAGMARRLEGVEAEHLALLGELRELEPAAAGSPGAEALRAELGELLDQAIEHEAIAGNIRRHLERAEERFRRLCGAGARGGEPGCRLLGSQVGQMRAMAREAECLRGEIMRLSAQRRPPGPA